MTTNANGTLARHQVEAAALWARLSHLQQDRAMELLGYLRAAGQAGASREQIERGLAHRGVKAQTFSTVIRNLRLGLAMLEREAVIYDPSADRYYLAEDWRAVASYVEFRTGSALRTFEATLRGVAAFLAVHPTEARALAVHRDGERAMAALERLHRSATA